MKRIGLFLLSMLLYVLAFSSSLVLQWTFHHKIPEWWYTDGGMSPAICMPLIMLLGGCYALATYTLFSAIEK